MPDSQARAPTVLFIDDDTDVLKTADLLLARRGFRMLTAREPSEALSILATEWIDVVLLDLNFSPKAVSGEEGLQLLDRIVSQDPAVAVLVVTGHSGINVAVAAMRGGAKDVIMKPWSNERLVAALSEAVARRSRHPEPQNYEEGSTLLGASPAIEHVRSLIRLAAPTPAPVLIRGEPGVGKSLVAATLHRQSAHRDGPFVVIDLAGAPPTASEEPAFVEREITPALADASGGTLLLDEVGGLSQGLQGQLLSQIERQGAQMRLLATTTRPRGELEAALRPALLHRLGTVEIYIPPLRERQSDISLLADHMARLMAARYRRAYRPTTPAALEVLCSHSWPDNVRGLSQAVERLVILTEGAQIDAEHLGRGAYPPDSSDEPIAPDFNLVRTERGLIDAALKRHGFNISRTAHDLGLTRAALYRRMAKHGF